MSTRGSAPIRLHIALSCTVILSISGLFFHLGTRYIPYTYPYAIFASDTMDSRAVHLLATLASNATSAATNGTAAAAGGHKVVAKKPKKHYYFMARNSWETIAGVIIALAFINLFTRGYAYWRRRRNTKQSAEMFLSKAEVNSTGSGDVKVSRIPLAGVSILQNLGLCTTLPRWLGGASLAELFWIIGYCAALSVFSFHQSKRERSRLPLLSSTLTSRQHSRGRNARRLG